MSTGSDRKEFEITGRLAGLNEIIAKDRFNRYSGGALKKKETNRCAEAIISQGVKKVSRPFTVSFEWIEPNARRDIDNVSTGAKFILDALVITERIPNDSRKWLRGLEHSFPDPDKKNPRILVKIKEIENGK